MPVAEFLELLAAGLPGETEVSLVRDLTRFVTNRAIDATFVHGGLLGRFLPPTRVAACDAEIAAAFRAMLDAAARGSGLDLSAARGLIAAAGPDDADELCDWLVHGAPAGLEMDAELRWAVFARLAVLGAAAEADLDAEADRDNTASGAVHAARCRASRPDPAAKERAWRSIVDDDGLSNRQLVAAAEGFWHPSQHELTESYVERYFTEMPEMARRRTPNMIAQIGTAAYPRYAVDPATIAAAEAVLERSDLNPVLRRVVVDCTDELRRALAARRLVEVST
jgi:aminopeptidase N